MSKKDYQKPSMKVVALHQNVHLLEGSGVEASRRSYGAATKEDWETSE